MTDRPAILGGTPVRAGKSWPRWPQWDETERDLLRQALESGAWSSSEGEQADRWAAEFAGFQGARHGLPLTNGTHTLEAALIACEVGEGDQVIVPALTFVATATAVLAVNAQPVLVDIDADSLCIDAAAADAAITERTRAIIVVHVAGSACDMDALVQLCERRGVSLIEDCAHAHGTRWRGRGAGSFGSFGSFSFEAHKLMTAGEGGALITSDEALRARAWSYANCGRAEGGHWYHHPTYGTNLRMTEWQGALLRAQLMRYPQQHRIREERASLLDAELRAVPGVRPQGGDPRMDSRARYSYVLHYAAHEFAGLSLRGFARALAAEGVVADRSYPSLHTLELFRAGNLGPRLRSGAEERLDPVAGDLARADRAAKSTLWLEHRMLLAEPDDVLDIPRAIVRIREHAPAIARKADSKDALPARIAAAARQRVRMERARGD